MWLSYELPEQHWTQGESLADVDLGIDILRKDKFRWKFPSTSFKTERTIAETPFYHLSRLLEAKISDPWSTDSAPFTLCIEFLLLSFHNPNHDF